MKKFLMILKSSKILIPVFIMSLLLGIFLFFYIPFIMEEGLVKNIVRHSKNAVERLEIEREYYTESVVRDVEKFAPQLDFDSNHEGVDGKLPFADTTVHDLSRMYSNLSDVKFRLFSEHQIPGHEKTVLTPFQKEALKNLKKNGGIYYKKSLVDGKPVLRVAIADHILMRRCIECHKGKKLEKALPDKWRQKNIKEVFEIITPMSTAMKEMYISRNRVLIASSLIMLLLFVYCSYILLKRENELNKEKERISEDLKDLSSHFDRHVIASKTDLDGKIIYASDRFCKISGFKREELIGKKHDIIRHPDTPEELYLQMWECVSNNKTWTGEMKNRKKNGDHYWVKAVVSPLYDHNGKKIGYTSIREDITDRKKIEELNRNLEKRVEEELRKNREKEKQLLHQSRLAQMGEMLSMIAHQWRQPLSAISSGSLAINIKAKLGKLDTDTAIALSEKISEYSQHLSSTIDDFRDFFKPNRDKDETTYEELILSALSIVQVSLKNKGIEVMKDLQCNASLKVYPNELKQVILNLIKNAEDALVERKRVDPRIRIKTYLEKDRAILEIEDNAGGISEDILENIFDPYFSTKSERNGTGLGLYMSKTIVEEHCGGKLEAKNGDEGAVFRVILEVQT